VIDYRLKPNEPKSNPIDAISHRLGDVVMLLGAVDTGKSTLARQLVERHRVDGAILIDTDLGQGSIGPPGTIASAWFGPQPSRDRTVGAAFIGAINPVGRSRDMATACAGLVAAARAMKPGIIVIDTCGLIQGRLGLALKRSLIAAISPNIVVGIERGHELQAILAPAERQPRAIARQVLSIAPSLDVGRKTAAARRRARDRRLAQFMHGASTVLFQVAQRGISRSPAGRASAEGLQLGSARRRGSH
jgi:polynucleotide 5'-kinase involved in rRNA processing